MNMFIIPYNLKQWLFCSFILICAVDSLFTSSARKLSYHFNPGCETPEYKTLCENETQLNLIHVTAESAEDTLHYLWSTWKLPTVIIARTSHNAQLNINWTELYNFESGAVSFSETPSYSFGFVVNEVWEFRDDQDKAEMNLNPNFSKPLNLSSLNWEDVNTTIQLTENLFTTFPKCSSDELVFSTNGSFGIKFSVTSEQTVSKDYPHLVFTGNSTQIQLIFDNLVTEHKSRFAVELTALSSDVTEDNKWQTSLDKSISDEFSPGVFRFLQLKTPYVSSHDDRRGFLNWKPVAYIGQTPSVANSSDASMSSLNILNISAVNVSNSLATSYFTMYPNTSQVTWYMTFGTSGDGFYSKTRYTSWSLMVGVGDSISQGLSKTAIYAIAVGLGLPLVLMIIATIYLGVTQCRKKDDELLLSQDSMN